MIASLLFPNFIKFNENIRERMLYHINVRSRMSEERKKEINKKINDTKKKMHFKIVSKDHIDKTRT